MHFILGIIWCNRKPKQTNKVRWDYPLGRGSDVLVGLTVAGPLAHGLPAPNSDVDVRVREGLGDGVGEAGVLPLRPTFKPREGPS